MTSLSRRRFRVASLSAAVLAGTLLAGSLVACRRGATAEDSPVAPPAGATTGTGETSPGTVSAGGASAPVATTVVTTAGSASPLRLRPKHWPADVQVGPVLEHDWRMRSAAIARYEAAGSQSVTVSVGVSPTLTLWVTHGNANGPFETVASMAIANATESVDVNGSQAVLSPFGEDGVYWIEPDGARVAVVGAGLTREQLLTAARALRRTASGAELAPAGLPEGWKLVSREPDRDVTVHTTAVHFTAQEASASTYATLLVNQEIIGGGATPAAPLPGAAPDGGPDRWSRATVQRIGAGLVSATWTERPGVSVTVTGRPEAEMRELMNGLEIVDESTWQRFREVVRGRATEAPSSTMSTDNVGVPALPGDTVWTWIARGQEIGFGHCMAYLMTDAEPREVEIRLPPYQSGQGFTEIEALTEEQRTFPCQP
jgi:hypothetical protein